jgi:PAS domain S-box-containing protein
MSTSPRTVRIDSGLDRFHEVSYWVPMLSRERQSLEAPMANSLPDAVVDNQLFHDVFHASPIGIVVENLDGQPLFINPAFCAMLGFSEEEVRSKHCVDFSPPEDAQKDWALFQRLQAGEIDHYQLEKRYVRGDGSLVWGSLSISVLKGHRTPLVIAMVQEITEKKMAEQARFEANRVLEQRTTELLAREELLRVFVKNVPAAVAMLDRDMRYLQVSDRWRTDYVTDGAEILGRSHYEIFPDMPERWKEVHRRALQGETLRADEDRWDAPDGPHWARWEVRPWQDADGRIGGILILAEDITRRKQMEQSLSGLSRKLIQSQEQERARIARELHDDVSQQLALLTVELGQCDRNAGDNVDLRNHLNQATRRIAEIGKDVQSLSHHLHSSKLEYLGLVVAAKSLSREISDMKKIRIDFKDESVPRTLPNEVSLSLFRILQQALHNAVEHSGTKHIKVRLWEHSDELNLQVEDWGKGFDLLAAMRGAGLGLTSMRERVRLVNGTLSIDSEPMRGTIIHVRVPLNSGFHLEKKAV